MSAPRRFRKNPVEIEAVEFLGGPNSATDVIEWILAGNGTARYVGRGEYHPARYEEELMIAHRDIQAREDAPAFLVIDTLEGAHRANGGDWIIRGVQGEFYPCKPDIFAQTYDEVHLAVAVPPVDRPEPRPLTATAAVQVRVIAEGEPYDGPILGTVAIVAPPEHVDEARRVISDALRMKVGYSE